MELGYVYRAETIQEAWKAVEELDRESTDLMAGMGVVILVRDDGSPDWYYFANLEDPQPEDKLRVTALLAAHGIPTDMSVPHLVTNPHVGLVAVGTLVQIFRGIVRWRRDLDEE